jgi:hypothetical protein
VLFKPLSTRNPKHSQDLACHYTFWTRAEKGMDVKRDMTPLDIRDMSTEEAVQKVASAVREMGVKEDV